MQLVHVTNRGVDGRNIFLDSQDYVRFVHDLYEFNDTSAAPEYSRRHSSDVGRRTSHIRENLVEIHGWVLMKNHYHLLLSELVDGGLSLFLKKLNGGYSKYFNERYERRGALFAGKTRKVPVIHHAHFLYVLHYIHLNPLDYLEGSSGWRERDKGTIKGSKAALAYLKTYRWSSYLDYCDIKNFPSLLAKSVFAVAYGHYESSLRDYLLDHEETLLAGFALE